mmetsp:Transcript_17098/g.21628  ORF Transcript_17098/g.21628 Transcript_17098/m.21628 type:complete len:153 (-) Transcript_17098:204-662(-)
MYAKTLLLALFAALAALTTVQACSDDKDFTWTYTFDGRRFTQHCSFLSNGNKATNTKRRNNHCSRNNVKRNCKKSCDNCGSNEPSNCKDSSSFRFTNGQSCSFLKQVSVQRKSILCGRTFNGIKAKRACRKSCNNCKSSEAELETTVDVVEE